jgi:outer membrane lipoprotein-sorting protein
MGTITLSRRARWAVPAGALAITGGIIGASLISVAQATPGLPAKTAAQLLAEAGSSVTPPFTGTVVETVSLGLPKLPSNTGGSPTSITSLLTGSNTVRVWYSSPEHFRLAVPTSLAETDVIRDGGTAWLWQSTADSVTEFTLPAHDQAAVPSPVASLTPQQAADQILARVGQTTTVSVDTNVMVAGRAAYELALAPKDPRSLIGQIRIAIDGSNGLPLRVEVFANGATSPAIQVGYTSIDFTAPAQSELTFTAPPGATVDKVDLAKGGSGQAGNDLAGAQTIGKGWLTVLELPSSLLNSATGGGQGQGNGPGNSSSAEAQQVLNALVGSASQVSGSWGTGRLLHTSLINVLITDSGKMFIGAVEPSVLYAAAAQG